MYDDLKNSSSETTKSEILEEDSRISGENKNENSFHLFSLKAVIKDLFKIQGRRAETYAKLRSHFTDFLTHGDEKVYKENCAQITISFNTLSSQVRKLETTLKDSTGERPVLGVQSEYVTEEATPAEVVSLTKPQLVAAEIRRLQGLEQTKLQMTCTLQVLKKAHEASAWEWQHEEDPISPSTPPSEGPEAAPRIHPRSWKRCSCSTVGCEEVGADPTRQEYHSAIAEATQALETSICGVNEILEELKYELEEE
mmetsp:Transcript_4425/g.5962  ORF Transcript_4425/g.5962 Transcript_4425/m.5962 type:complete len:254 (+) Transcript_4425:104-865(+)